MLSVARPGTRVRVYPPGARNYERETHRKRRNTNVLFHFKSNDIRKQHRHRSPRSFGRPRNGATEPAHFFLGRHDRLDRDGRFPPSPRPRAAADQRSKVSFRAEWPGPPADLSDRRPHQPEPQTLGKGGHEEGQ